MTSRPAILLLACLTAGLSACSAEFSIGGQSVEDAATELIEGELAEQLDLELTAACPAVDEPEVGTEFTCTAITADGETVNIAGLVDREDHIDLGTTNVVRGDALATIAGQLAGAVTEQVGFEVTAECGDTTVVLPANNELVCTVDSAEAGEAPAIVTITDTDTGAFDWRIDG